jgi:adenine deaminase
MSRCRPSSLVVPIWTVLLALMVCGTASAQARYDLVIQGGRVLDPETSLDVVRDVGIRGNQIAAISEQPLVGTRVINASGLVVAPALSISTNTTRPSQGTA